MKTFLLLLLSLTASAETSYIVEINTLRDRERQYVGAASDRLIALGRYQTAMERIERALQYINGSSLFQDAPYSSTSQLSPSRQKLRALGDRYGRLLGAAQSLEFADSIIREALARASQAAADMPDLAATHAQIASKITNKVVSARQIIRESQTSIDQQFDLWIEWEIDAQYRALADSRRAMIEDAQFRQTLSEASITFGRISGAVARTLANGDLEKASELSNGANWLRAQLPAFYLGLTTTRERSSQIKDLYQKLDRQISDDQKKINDALKAQLSEPEFHAFMSDDPNDELGPNIFETIPPNEPGEARPTREHNWGELGEVNACTDDGKQIVDYDAPGASAELQHGYAQIDPRKGDAPVRVAGMPKGAEFGKMTAADLDSAIRSETARINDILARDFKVRPGVEGGFDNPSIPPSALDQSLDQLDKMVDDAHDNAPTPEQRQDLEPLKYEKDRFKQQLARYDQKVAQAVREAGQSAAGVSQKLDELRLSKVSEAGRPVIGDPGPRAGASSKEEAIELAKIYLDFTLGILPGIGNAYNLTNFMNSVLTGYTIMGQPTTLTDQTLLGIAAILPFAPQMIAAGKSVAAVAAAVKASKGGKGLNNGAMLAGHAKAVEKGGEKILEAIATRTPGASAAVLKTFGKASEVAKMGSAEANAATKAMLGPTGEFVESFAAGKDALKTTVGKDAQMKGYRLSKSPESLSPFGSLEKPPTPGDLPAVRDYLTRHGVDPAQAEAYKYVHERTYSEGAEVMIGEVGRIPEADGGAIQVVSKAIKGVWKDITDSL